MTTDMIYKTILDVLEDCGYDRSTISDSTNFLTDLGMDSLTIFEIEYQVETRLDIKLTDGDHQLATTVNELVNSVVDKLNIALQES